MCDRLKVSRGGQRVVGTKILSTNHETMQENQYKKRFGFLSEEAEAICTIHLSTGSTARSIPPLTSLSQGDHAVLKGLPPPFSRSLSDSTNLACQNSTRLDSDSGASTSTSSIPFFVLIS